MAWFKMLHYKVAIQTCVHLEGYLYPMWKLFVEEYDSAWSQFLGFHMQESIKYVRSLALEE